VLLLLLLLLLLPLGLRDARKEPPSSWPFA
jgi:hypothetical protein